MANGTYEPMWCKERHDRLEGTQIENATTLEELEAIKW
jgi:hypothetical protein